MEGLVGVLYSLPTSRDRESSAPSMLSVGQRVPPSPPTAATRAYPHPVPGGSCRRSLPSSGTEGTDGAHPELRCVFGASSEGTELTVLPYGSPRELKLLPSLQNLRQSIFGGREPSPCSRIPLNNAGRGASPASAPEPPCERRSHCFREPHRGFNSRSAPG